MKKTFLPLVIAVMFLAIASFINSGCTKEGPEGPAGTNGADGIDGATTCGQCHNLSSDLFAKIEQYEASGHGILPDHERNGTSCAPCHTHQGFLEVLETGQTVTAAAIENPVRVNCRTCHPIHETYTVADYGLRVTDPVTLQTGDVVDFGDGNMCANCHQGRLPDPFPVPGGADIVIGSSRYGYHHGPQSNILSGTGGYEVPGSLVYTTPPTAHGYSIDDGCVTCHMAEAFGTAAGGHTWNMTYDYHGSENDNIAGCETCHPGIEDFDLNDVQTDIQVLLDSLASLMVTAGVQTASGSAVAGTWSADLAGARINWQMCTEDRSLGVHNSKYVKALLTNSIESL